MSRTVDEFLADVDAQEIDWVRPNGAPAALTPVRVSIGAGADALEVALATAASAPRMDEVRRLWSLRWARRAAPVLLVVAYPGEDGQCLATVCGPGEDPAAIAGLDMAQVERICAASLAEPNAAAGKRTLLRLLVGPKDQLIAGLTNQGLFASHELRHGVPARADWDTARETGRGLLGRAGPDLITALGYSTTAHGSLAQVLSSNGQRHALAVLLNADEVFDRPGHRFGAVSPVTQGLAIAQEQGLPWLIVTRGTQVRLYPAKPNIGVGRKGQSETFVELDLALLTEADAAYVPLLFGPSALSSGGTVEEILATSADHASALGARLRDRVYVDVVPALAVAVANAMENTKGGELDEDDLHEAYHRTLIILFRLLFVAYAEDRGLLPYQRNPRYTRKALKTLAREFAEDPAYEFDAHSFDRWDDLLSVWRAVDDGNREWDVPAYNGGLFAADEAMNPSGYAIGQMRLSNAEIGPALKALLIDAGADGDLGPVDFRSLSVREFGTVYEGLLESSLSVAPSDLTVDGRTKAFLPAKTGDTVVVPAGEVYFHNASGARKATGSYFTKTFAVEHMLDTSLEPALEAHLAQVLVLLEAGDEDAAAEKFFDLRVADLAMGSGHFLVAAIDRIEHRFAHFLSLHPIARISDELSTLATVAAETLGEAAAAVEIETSTVLRRQIARRCVYGLDLNLMAVELARLAIWIHTFVPGLPMSSLDHGLQVGNSLTGIGTVEEVLDVLEPGRDPRQASLFGEPIQDALDAARLRLLRVARTAEAKKAEVKRAAEEHAKARAESADARAMFDAATGIRSGIIKTLPFDSDEAIRLGNDSEVQAHIATLQTVHLPFLFPEVFLRETPGFDVLLGNPPWEKVLAKEDYFWAGHFPGLNAMPQKEMAAAIKRYRSERPDLAAEFEAEDARQDMVRAALLTGPYPGLGSGHPDLFKAFCWRNWQLVRTGGFIGIVLPRPAFGSTGGAAWRAEVLDHGQFSQVTILINTGQWVFDDVHAQYSFALAAVRKGEAFAGEINIDGPYRSLAEYRRPAEARVTTFDVEEFKSWTEDASLPIFPTPESVEIFAALRRSPGLGAAAGGFEVRAVQGDFNSTTDKGLFDFDLDTPSGSVPVYKGGSFHLWQPQTGVYYAYTDLQIVVPVLTSKRQRQARKSGSAFYGTDVSDPNTLPMFSPRISYRRYCNQENYRTLVTALVPGGLVLVDGAPYLVFREGDRTDEAFVLGVMSSIPFDWYVRKVVERNITFDVLNSLPVPRPERDHPLRARAVEIAGRLAATDARFADWAAKVGVPVGSVNDEATKDALVAELDALICLLYGLTRGHVQHIFATFKDRWNYQPRLDAVLAHYDRWQAAGAGNEQGEQA